MPAAPLGRHYLLLLAPLFAGILLPPRPALAGRGRGEGLSQRAQLAERAPHPKPSASTSPRQERGEVHRQRRPRYVAAARRARKNMAITLSSDHAMPGAPLSARLTTPQVWGILLLVPYFLVFLAFVVYPVGYGLWLARDPASYVAL